MLSIVAIKNALKKLPDNVRWDITQFALNLIGIFDPSPIADGTNTIISLCRGDWFGAAINAVSIIPGADVAKILKLEKYLTSLKSLVALAKKNMNLRVAILPMMEAFSKMLDRLPKDNNTIVRRLQGEIDLLLKLPCAPVSFPAKAFKHTSPEHLQIFLNSNGFQKVVSNDVSYRVASSSGGAAGPKQIWSKFDADSNGYFVVRMDTQGHAFKADLGPGNISVVSQTRSGVHLSHGGRPHYHKEWVPSSEHQQYLSRPTPNTVKYNDLGELADDLKGTHIPR
ncbi:hypothetical protein NA78x_000441 [Anatilimnocola sp. NA78]|uniref:hypothetical protein n=1 Tax=Anatilimnocola sp. NA78 TaxID=3415683 RepID=UPI003CE4CE0E